MKGMSVFPSEIESVLGQHAAVTGSGVIGRTDGRARTGSRRLRHRPAGAKSGDDRSGARSILPPNDSRSTRFRKSGSSSPCR